MNICIFGGTFSPIHIGHINMAKYAYDEFNIDKLYFIPSGDSYFKTNVISKEHRLDMVKIAVKDISKNSDYDFHCSDYEVKKDGPSYSYETIEEFKLAYPNDNLFFLVGLDTILEMDKWKNPASIFRNSVILVAMRSNAGNIDDFNICLEKLSAKYDCNIKVFAFDIDISSSQLRDMIAHDDEAYKDYLTDGVIKYIKDKELYR